MGKLPIETEHRNPLRDYNKPWVGSSNLSTYQKHHNSQGIKT